MSYIDRMEDPRGVRLIVCGACLGTFQTQEAECPRCGKVAGDPRPVSCADLNHNEPEGCDNPDCWKYVEKKT